MDITPYVESLRHDLAAAAEAGGPEAKAAAERLALALDPAVRLALMDALSQAAAEITSELDVRLRRRAAARARAGVRRRRTHRPPMPAGDRPGHRADPAAEEAATRRTRPTTERSPASPCGSPSR